MEFATALSTHLDSEAAVHDVIEKLQQQGQDYDLAVLFFTPHHSGDADSIAQTLLDHFKEPALIGCSCEGVIGESREIETMPGLSVMMQSVWLTGSMVLAPPVLV